MDAIKNFKDNSIKYFSDYTKNFSTQKILALSGSFVGGVIAGFVFNKYGKSLFFLILFLIVGLFLLDNIQFITLHQSTIKEFFGVSKAGNWSDIFLIYVNLVKSNMVESLFFATGFLIGWKLG